MKFDINIQTGIVAAEFSLDEFQEVIRALTGTTPVPEAAHLPEVVTFNVSGYTQSYVSHDGEAFWVCSCPDFRYRRQGTTGDQCKHIPVARLEYAHDSVARSRWAA